MNEKVLKPFNQALSGEINIPGDKSISHRAVIFGSLAQGTTKVTHFLDGEDCMRTVNAFREMGVTIQEDGESLVIESNGISALSEPKQPLNFGNSGTTTRLMLGILSGLPFFTTVFGDDSLSRRPMNRVVNPLRQMGANIDGRNSGNLLPLSVKGSKLKCIDYTLPVKSAQVKSAILLAGLLAEGETRVTEQTPTRNHTENMLKAFGADITSDGYTTVITGKNQLKATNVHVPGDISSAAFFLVAGAIVPGSKLRLKNTGLNETRNGIIEVLQKMGANIAIENERTVSGELIGDIQISYHSLKGITIEGEIIPRLIDEIPVIALLASQAEGTTIIKDAEELRVKETDRITAVCDVLNTLGANITPTEDGMVIEGKTKLNGGSISSYDDHRIAMMGAIASLITADDVIIDDISCISISYPDFFKDLKSLK
ncbi:3-phosphoshikimate 1-carboxyvinyltransferase [Oceanobacillus damuensis]|uniref:3-phosphoshikimate 1-carboxyvinyltransferase n=1 Tax=Oceanobacillus damuensis TaxID=937928 RepID=UPI000831C088|nr:3-phosphoshikimate 1-carboxyvinyltransferase [Oceanobacillus damuensis]